jgi:hypothetical protein
MVIAAAAALLVFTERHLATRRSILRSFDLHAREVAGALADARAAQQGYLAPGQSASAWMPKVSALIQEASATVDALRAWASSDAARQALLDASASIGELRNVDKRVRDYISGFEPIMANDLVYSEGSAASIRASQSVEAARLSEHQAVDSDEMGRRRLEAFAIGGAASWSMLMLLVLATRPRGRTADAPDQTYSIAPTVESTQPPAAFPPPDTARALQSAALVCTEMARMQDVSDLRAILGEVAPLLDASGLVLWLGDAAGSDLRPLAALGYSDQMLARMRAVPRLADNAAAAAYRTGLLQVVRAGPAGTPGAIAAPILAAEGCIGALTAEVVAGHETSAELHSLAAIVTAQLASALAPPAPVESSFPQPRTASA